MKKLISLILVLAVFAVLYAVDFFIAKQYSYELLNNSDAVITADGESTVKFRVKLTRNGEPAEGHVIYIFASNGSLPVSRVVTDSDGEFSFRYYPYTYLDKRLTPLEDIKITFQDESNSVFFQVSASRTYSFKTVKPYEEDNWTDWQNLNGNEG